MRLPAVALAAFLVPSVAFACPGKTATADASEPDATHVTAKTETSEHLDATACAKKAELVGAACSYSTGMMASRVLEQGKSFSYTGKLTPTDEALASQVAAPFVVGPEKVRVIANEVVESAQGHDRMTFQGKVLEVDGVQYFVVTSYEKASA
ncbi:MAG: hypothetical protein H6737_12690 [Alphaproteobacteria bacterium]|nr:hypothetical protein [Alphaproteobacteria bacterium]